MQQTIKKESFPDLTDIRICRYIWHRYYLDNVWETNKEPSTVNKYSIEILSILDHESIRDLILDFKEYALTTDELTCIDSSNERLLRFIWGKCKNCNLISKGNPLDINIQNLLNGRIWVRNSPYGGASEFDYLVPNSNPLSKKIIYSEIIQFFDLLAMSRNSKKEILKTFIANWDSVYKQEKFYWLDFRNKLQLEWIEKYLDKNNIPKSDLIINKNTTNSDQLYYYISIIDMWRTSTKDKCDFIHCMKKAWLMKESRNKKKQLNTKSLTGSISKKATNMLNEIAKSYGVSSKEMMEELIKEGHKNLVKN